MTSNFMIKPVVSGSGSKSQTRSRRFIQVCPEFAPPSKMASLTSKLSMAKAFYLYFLRFFLAFAVLRKPWQGNFKDPATIAFAVLKKNR